MKKVLLSLVFAFSISLMFFNCSSDNENDVNYSKISESKLKQLMQQEENAARDS